MAEQPGIKPTQTLDIGNRLPVEKFQYVNVRFETADMDVAIRHRLNPVDAEDVIYQVVRRNRGETVYQDFTPTRRPWQRGVIYLRATGPVHCTILLALPADEEEPLRAVQVQAVEEEVTPLDLDLTRSFGITIDAGTSVITTGLKGMVRVPVNGVIQKVTLMSTDASVTSGSIAIDLWRDSLGNYSPTVADSICAANYAAISSATKSEDVTLSGWTRSFNAGDVFAFNVNSVTSLKRVTMVVDYLETLA